MKKEAMQEILFLINSSVAKRNLMEVNPSLIKWNHNNNINTLEAACWNGLLSEWLPETTYNNKDMFIWKISVAKSFMGVDLSKSPVSVEYAFSLNPYLFLPSKQLN